MIDVEKVRRWIVNFSCLHPMASLPFPQMLVYEQEGADYLIPLYDVKSLPPESGGQLTLTIGGCGQLIAGGEKYDLRPGNAFLYRHRDDGVRYFTAKDSEEPWRFIWISFGGVSADRLIAEINARYGYFFDVGMDGALLKTLTAYESFAGKMLTLLPIEGAALVLNLLAQLCHDLELNHTSVSDIALADRLESELHSFQDTSLSVSALAKRMGVSREHLSKTFREENGQTLRDYHARQRLDDAVLLLRQSNMNCKEIALCCHYGSYSSFFRAFRKRYGISPEVFRKK